MFTGIIESTGKILGIQEQGSNRIFEIESPLSNELKVDQSLSHNGVCLTVESTHSNCHSVTAIKETLDKTNLKDWEIGSVVNLERCLQMNGRIDGHIVQGHVDTTANCVQMKDKLGSWEYIFEFDPSFSSLIIEKGSITLNGISLTVFNVNANQFTVAVIPYTYNNTNMHPIEPGCIVNIEFDMIGKYINRIASLQQMADQ
jgi:riboflavin synthase